MISSALTFLPLRRAARAARRAALESLILSVTVLLAARSFVTAFRSSDFFPTITFVPRVVNSQARTQLAFRMRTPLDSFWVLAKLTFGLGPTPDGTTPSGP